MGTIGFVACFASAVASKVPCDPALEADGDETCALQVSTNAKQIANIATTDTTTPAPYPFSPSLLSTCADCPEGHGEAWCTATTSNTAECNACKAGVSVDVYCANNAHASVPGCGCILQGNSCTAGGTLRCCQGFQCMLNPLIGVYFPVGWTLVL